MRVRRWLWRAAQLRDFARAGRSPANDDCAAACPCRQPVKRNTIYTKPMRRLLPKLGRLGRMVLSWLSLAPIQPKSVAAY